MRPIRRLEASGMTMPVMARETGPVRKAADPFGSR